MQRGFAFKLMATKDIAGVLQMIGMHPAATPENIDKPSPETALGMYQHLGEFAYDMDLAHVKARAHDVPSVGMYMEIFDEAMDVVAIFKLAKQLALINRVEDFSIKDIWDPQAKRLRAVASGMINFCRYKESQTNVIQTMKAEVQALDSHRLELVDMSNAKGHELAEAQAQHSAELQEMWDAENVLQEAQTQVDKLQKQKQIADRLQESVEAKVEAAKERVAQQERRAENFREEIAILQEQVAESPEGLEKEIAELQRSIRAQKSRVDEKTNEKRARTQRVQVLGRLKGNIEHYKELLEKVEHVAAVRDSACERTRCAQNDLAAMRSSLDARRGEEGELTQAVEQVTLDMETAKQTHVDQVREFEENRQQAVAQHQELQEKRTEEQRQSNVLQGQRAELEAEIASERRAYEAEMNELSTKLRLLQEDSEIYIQTVDGCLAQYDAEAGRAPVVGYKSSLLASPGSAAKRRSSLDVNGSFSCSPGRRASPAPRRLIMERSGFN